ncbi:MAG: hydantoinase/oxoprolinase family protein [Armatimonadota bacterium]|nr:hydantoinase/oxoprolinase family protein [Armatimonadota bacterium]MDR7510404.1 hydantoinase/oxoprolinase family protein [Armatimonadota bacterium]
MSGMRPYRIGLDIGGTFTDLVLVHDPTGRLAWHKVLTTPRAPADGALAGLHALCAREGIALADVGTLVHATTLVTNALIERRGARTALLATDGFRDTLEIGKEQRYDIYDLFLRYPEPLVPRRWRVDVPERITRDGTVRRPLDLEAVRRRVAALTAEGVEAVAVCLLHAYVNPDHERQIKGLLEAEFPGLAVSISSEVSPEIREFERTSTTVCNAYVQPLVDRYLRRMETALAEAGFGGRFLLMLSSGTLAAPEVARRFPVRLLESGPAAGALIAGHLGLEAGRRDVVGFDMGGTTAKICLVRDGRPSVVPTMEVARVHRFKPGSGLPVKTPVVDMIEIGAGGGSLARVDALGLLRVGPQSAGADPGPACYGQGGTEATVTDACVALGYYDPAAFLGGAMPLDARAAAEALARAGAPLGLDVAAAAWGIFAIVCESMASAARLYLIERGVDPRRFALVAFGGAGPAVAARVARLLGMEQVLIPPASGLASALGLLAAPPGFEFGHSLAGELAELPWGEVRWLLARMEDEGRRMVAAAGAAADGATVERRVEMRYAGQFHDIEVALPPDLDGDPTGELAARFRAEYVRRYGVPLDGYPIQTLNWRVLVSGPTPRVDLRGSLGDAAGEAGARKGTRPVYLPDRGFVEVPVYDRYRLDRGAAVAGPAVIEEAEATTLLWAGDQLTVDAGRNLVIRVGAAPQAPAAESGLAEGAPRAAARPGGRR